MDIKSLMPLSPVSNSNLDKVTQSNDSQGAAFGDFLNNALNQVNNMQQDAQTASEQLATGEIGDIHQVMIAAEKASLSMQLTLQVRDKVLEAYQEIMRTQI